jgi:hypothetical protein
LAEREQSEIRLHNIWCNFFLQARKMMNDGPKRIKMKLAFTTCDVKQNGKCNLNQLSSFRGESCGRTDLHSIYSFFYTLSKEGAICKKFDMACKMSKHVDNPSNGELK